MPQNSSRARYSSGVPKYENSKRKTNRLSSDSERSMKYTVVYVIASSASERTSTTSATSSEKTSQPTLHHTPSRKLGSRPRAKKCRSTHRHTTVTTARITHGSGPLKNAKTTASDEEEDEREHHVDRQQLQALEPGRLTLLGDLLRDQDR